MRQATVHGRKTETAMSDSSSQNLGRFVRRIATGVALVGVHGTLLATSLARRMRAVHLRIDTMEQAIWNAGLKVSGPEGYLAARNLAEDNLRIGHTVIVASAIRWRLLATTGTQPRRVWRWISWRSRLSASTSASIASGSNHASVMSPALYLRLGSRLWTEATSHGRPHVSWARPGAHWRKPYRRSRPLCGRASPYPLWWSIAVDEHRRRFDASV